MSDSCDIWSPHTNVLPDVGNETAIVCGAVLLSMNHSEQESERERTEQYIASAGMPHVSDSSQAFQVDTSQCATLASAMVHFACLPYQTVGTCQRTVRQTLQTLFSEEARPYIASTKKVGEKLLGGELCRQLVVLPNVVEHPFRLSPSVIYKGFFFLELFWVQHCSRKASRNGCATMRSA